MFRTIQNLRHFIRTAYGNSKNSYGPARPPELPYQGALQGNGAAGFSWTGISSPLIESMRSLGHGYTTSAALTGTPTKFVCFTFVDDCDLDVSGQPDHSAASLTLARQQALDDWDGLLRITGGALEKLKSYWYHIDYSYRNGKWRYIPPAHLPGNISLLNDHTKTKEPIERLHVTSACKSLGIYTRPDGGMTEEKNHLRKLAETLASSLRTAHIRTPDAWYCVNSTILKSIEYPLTMTTFTKEECNSIMAPILKAILPAVRVQRNLPRVLVYAPLRYQGLGIQDPWILQLIEHIHVFLRHGATDSIMGKLQRTNIEHLTLELGSATPFWELDYNVWGHIATKSWLTSTWRDACILGLILRGPTSLPSLARGSDIFLMDQFVSYGFRTEELQILNEVRMYKKAVLLSDISSADGLLLLPSAFDVEPSRSSPYTWPRCSRPSSHHITFWANSLKRCFLPAQTSHL